MFSNIIYFVVVLLIYNLGPEGKAEHSLHNGAVHLAVWLSYALVCRRVFGRLEQAQGLPHLRDGYAIERFHSTSARLSILAVALFGCSIYLFNLKGLIPGPSSFSSLNGLAVVGVFVLYLCTMWWFGYRSHCAVFETEIGRRAYLVSQIRLNLPILFPWVAISLLYDILGYLYPAAAEEALNSPTGQLVVFAVVLLLLIAIMPKAIQFLWGCRPFEDSNKKRLLETFLKERGFRYRALLRWPLLEGKTLTAGIMGVVPRYRYILITEALFDLLSVEELKAVLAHEMGHARYKHLLIYLVFFIGYAAFSYGFFEIVLYAASGMPFFSEILMKEGAGGNMYYLVLSVPVLAVMIIYFRYVMGFFMRNFERQADLFSASIMGGADALISSLEKIAYFSGKSRDVPSWHHFSIKERVDLLRRFVREPAVFAKHNRFLALCFGLYLLCITTLSYGFNAEPVRMWMLGGIVTRALERQASAQPGNLAMQQALAVLYHQKGKLKEAASLYEAVLRADPKQPLALNNLAWLLVTSQDEDLRDPKKGLALAKAAAQLDRSSVVLDTLAEAFYANGMKEEALAAINEALSLASEKRDYYLSQRDKILSGQSKAK
jgi:Zn-dependent protease with chaperone function